MAAHWLWLVAGLALAAAELIAPGFFLIWIGAAALVTGLATLALGLPAVAQAGVFALLAIAAVVLGRRWLARHPIATADPELNDRAARLVGLIVTVVEPIAGGRGRVRVGDGVWNAAGPDAPADTKARVTGAQGTTLTVEPCD